MKHIEDLIDECLLKLGEHCDAVQILCSVVGEDGRTTSINLGAGNWYARQGLAREFISIDQANDTARAISQYITPPDDGDNWKDS